MPDTRTAQDADLLVASLTDMPPAMARPVMVVVSGLPGAGKSSFSRRLVELVPLLVLETDVLRRVLVLDPTYSKEESARLFQACHLLISRLLKQGVPLLLDATNLVEAHRERLYHIAEQTGVRLVLVFVTAPPEVIRGRLQRRQEGIDGPQDHSTADWSVYQRMRISAEPLRRSHFTVDTSRDLESVMARIAGEIRRWMRTA